MKFLKIDKKFKVNSEHSDQKTVKQTKVNPINIDNIKTESNNYQLNSNNTFD